MDSIGLMVLDMDSFKNINDLYDRSFGDEVLHVRPRRWRPCFRPTPCSTGWTAMSSVFSPGGDAKRRPYIWQASENFCSKQQEYGGKKYFCTPVGGYACLSGDGVIIWNSGRQLFPGIFQNHGKEPDDRVFQGYPGRQERRLELLELLRGERGARLCRVHHPLPAQVDTVSGRLCGAEAWPDGTTKYGDVSPGEFIL